MTIVIAKVKPIKEIVVRSPYLRNFLNLGNFIRNGPLKNLYIGNPIENSLIVKIKLPNPKEVV